MELFNYSEWLNNHEKIFGKVSIEKQVFGEIVASACNKFNTCTSCQYSVNCESNRLQCIYYKKVQPEEKKVIEIPMCYDCGLKKQFKCHWKNASDQCIEIITKLQCPSTHQR